MKRKNVYRIIELITFRCVCRIMGDKNLWNGESKFSEFIYMIVGQATMREGECVCINVVCMLISLCMESKESC